MILTYNAKESFVQDILEGRKIHTIREDKNDRWYAGRKIHHWWRNPRNKHLNPYCFLENECTIGQYLHIYRDVKGSVFCEILDTRKLVDPALVAANDGLTLEEFIDYFLPPPINSVYRKIIHWTDFRY